MWLCSDEVEVGGGFLVAKSKLLRLLRSSAGDELPPTSSVAVFRRVAQSVQR